MLPSPGAPRLQQKALHRGRGAADEFLAGGEGTLLENVRGQKRVDFRYLLDERFHHKGAFENLAEQNDLIGRENRDGVVDADGEVIDQGGQIAAQLQTVQRKVFADVMDSRLAVFEQGAADNRRAFLQREDFFGDLV